MFFYTLKAECLFANVTDSGEVTNAENIKADRPKILRPTHFSGPKDIKAEKWVVGVVP
jgi:hypothetical protein